ncbi:pyruvate carboxylase [Blastochloris viridis]|uniref:Pyruvate carboxylase n=1 Tax=Blastochloris viridis TaxID=1079 RepID=A0A0H5BQE5_BLAVI|nr:pyruvate carboxylase [Blastochloris viridis]ALK09315.1 2-oxoglutarate carboxylase small subunit [Blastochloris viridis]BAS00809.1 pyruvate carboxylase [Blastochloris viridis]CUU41978.1 2-oxoglutarate carboxylase small subunit [Blastochloris viridis]
MSASLSRPIRRLLVANRSEIAIRVFRAATELGIRTVAIYAEEDKLSLHRFKADEAYEVGKARPGADKLGPIAAYLSIDEVIRVAREARVDAIHPGYGFLSENPEFAEACGEAGIVFIGPEPQTMRTLGNKVSARNLAVSVGVPVMPATDPLPDDPATIERLAAEIGYPVMLKASWGGGGRGMRPIEGPAGLIDTVTTARREAKAAFGKDEVYLEKLVRRARHIEVQLLGDRHGNLVHLFERDCTIQRRHQKVVERAPAPYLDDATRAALAEAALKIGRATSYVGAGTVEFLMDADTGAFYFIEVNPRIQVEHTVTEVVTGLDIVKAQIHVAQGGRLGEVTETGIPPQADIRLDGHAMQCRITTENPENNFIPDYGRITAYRGAFGFGIRVDGGTAYSGAVVTPFYDPMLEKVTAWAPSPEETIARMERALREYRIRGVATNLVFLEALLGHPRFRDGSYTTRFIDETPELFQVARPRDRATKLLGYIADVTVNGHPEVKGRAKPPATARTPVPPYFGSARTAPTGTKQLLDQLGPSGFAAWMKAEKRVLITDTTMRDAHQSLLATRMRSFDIIAAAEAYATGLPQLFSLECWGGATFDVAMRFLTEDPWERLATLRERVPNLLLQMLLRGANGVGYTNYPDNVVRFFVKQAAEGGIDVFRVFDCLNWVENMRVAIDAVGEAGKLAEGAICYTGDILDPNRAKYSLRYYVDLAKQLEAAGCHILGIKDMAGLLKPAAARVLVKALKEEVGVPIHLHTHDTSGISGASVLAAIEAGADAVDAAMDAMSGLTSQPCLGSIVEALEHTERETGLDHDVIRHLSFYWEAVRDQYAAFESDLKAGASEVYLHEMPGGQFTNLKEQARALGLDTRWHDVAKAYRAANDLFGDIVKVTPSSKVVGDMALIMVSQGITPAEVVDPAKDIAFPASVVEMLRGDLGQPPGGWPAALVKKALKGKDASTARPGALLADTDLEAQRGEVAKLIEATPDDFDLAAFLMYPKVYGDFVRAVRKFGPVSTLPTPVYFYGMKLGEEIAVEIERGKTLVISLQAIGETDEDGHVEVFFELNGQPRFVKVPNRAVSSLLPARRKAEDGNDAHVAAPLPGSVAALAVKVGSVVSAGDVLMTIEAMKMETALHSPRAGTVKELLVHPGSPVDAKDLLVVFEG